MDIKGVAGIFEAYSNGNDVTVADGAGKETVFHFLRNQEKKDDGVPNLSLSDFILPEGSKVKDHMGLFVVSAYLNENLPAEMVGDDYAMIMLRILTDRLAEAATEKLHLMIRKERWGYAPDEKMSLKDMLANRYQGIRPAPGYPACPDHSEKQQIFDLLDAPKVTGTKLTGNFAMDPPASVCGYYFAHPGASYFNVGKIEEDQLTDYAERKGWSMSEAKKWLGSNL